MRFFAGTSLNAILVVVVGLLAGCANGQHNNQISPIFVPDTMKPAPRQISVHDLLSLRDIGGYYGELSVSPDGEHVAIQIQQAVVADNAYRTGWFVVDVKSPKTPVPAGEGGEPILFGEDSGYINGSRVAHEAKWSPDGRWFAYRLKRYGEIQIWRSSADGKIQEKLTSNAGNVGALSWSDDSNHIYFRVGSSRAARAAALQAEGENGYLFDERFVPYISTKPLFENSEQATNPFFTDHTQGLWAIDVTSGNERLATERESEVFDRLIAVDRPQGLAADRDIRRSDVAPNAIQFSWFENEDPITFAGPDPQLALYAQTIDGEENRCSAPECVGKLSWLFWSNDGAEVIFSRRAGFNDMESQIYAWRPGENAVRIILKTEELLDDCEMSVHGVICIHESSTTPRKIILVDPTDGSLKTVFDPNPEFQNIEFSRVETLKWQEEGGAEAHGHLVYPADYEEGRRYPLVIVQYRSRGFLRGGIGDEYPIHPLATHGFFVLSIDRPDEDDGAVARNPNRFEREREEWREFRERKRILSALEIIVDKLDARELIDPARVGLSGLSDGAETVWYALIHSNKFAAVATSSGGYSQNMYYLFSASTRRESFQLASDLAAPEIGDDSRWKEVVVDFHADRINTPILVQVSDQELLWSTSNFGSLADAGKPIEVYVFPGEYHIKVQPKHRLAVYSRNVDWFNFWLRDVENQHPAKTEQYTRWRNMRELSCTQQGDVYVPSYCDTIGN